MNMKRFLPLIFSLAALVSEGAEQWPLIRIDYDHRRVADYRQTAQYLGLQPSFRIALDAALHEARTQGIQAIVVSMYRPQILQDQIKLQRLATNHPTPTATVSKHTSREATDIWVDPNKLSQWDSILQTQGLHRPLPVSDANHLTWILPKADLEKGGSLLPNDMLRQLDPPLQPENHLPDYDRLARQARDHGTWLRELDTWIDRELQDTRLIEPDIGHRNSWSDDITFGDWEFEVDVGNEQPEAATP